MNPSIHHLENQDIWQEIASFLPILEYKRLSRTCKLLHVRLPNVGHLNWNAYLESFSYFSNFSKSKYSIHVPMNALVRDRLLKEAFHKRVRLNLYRLTQEQYEHLCQHEFFDQVLEILQIKSACAKIDVTCLNNFAIGLAAEMNDHDLCRRLLLDKRVDAFMGLIGACQKGNLELVSFFLSQPGIDQSKNDNFPLVVSSKAGHEKVVDLLLNSTIHVDPNCNFQLPVRIACTFGHSKVLQRFLNDSRVDPNAHGNSLLLESIFRKHKSCIQVLIDDPRVDIGARENALLTISAELGWTDIVEKIIHRVDPSIPNNQALSTAAEEGHAEIVAMLCRDSRVDVSSNSNFAFCVAIQNGHLDTVRVLLENQVDPSCNDNIGVIISCIMGYPEILELLLQYEKVNPAIHSNMALREASAAGHIQCTRLLLDDARVKNVMFTSFEGDVDFWRLALENSIQDQ